MKDLYTFDADVTDAHKTYNEVRAVYRGFLNELTIPYIEAQADSGDMGGDLSHEYHFPNDAGEDTVITCTACNTARNEEHVSRASFTPRRIESPPPHSNVLPETTQIFRKSFLGKTGRDLVRVFGLASSEKEAGFDGPPELINSYAVKAALADVLELDTGVEDASKKFSLSHHCSLTGEKGQGTEKHRIFYVLDQKVPDDAIAEWWLQICNIIPTVLSFSSLTLGHIKRLIWT